MFRFPELIAKMKEYEIKNFSQEELLRAFAGCCSPIGCRHGVAIMLADGLTIADVYAPIKPNRPTTYCRCSVPTEPSESDPSLCSWCYLLRRPTPTPADKATASAKNGEAVQIALPLS